MSLQTTDLGKYFSLDEAKARAEKWRHDTYGYDGSATVWKDPETGWWAVEGQKWSSCD